MVKSLRPTLAGPDSDDRAAQQFYRIGEAKPEQAGVAASFVLDAPGQASLALPAQQSSLTGGAEPAQAGVAGSFIPDAAARSGLDQPAGAATFPADDPPTVDDTQILIALKDGSLFLFDKALLSGHPLELRDALGEVGLVFDNSDQDSDVLADYGLTNLLGGWLSELHALAPAAGANGLDGHTDLFF